MSSKKLLILHPQQVITTGNNDRYLVIWRKLSSQESAECSVPVKGTWKQRQRQKEQLNSAAVVSVIYEVHDEMSITTISLKEFLSWSKTKKGLCKLLSQALLEHLEGSLKQVVVAYNTLVQVNSSHAIEEDFEVHEHEAAGWSTPRLHSMFLTVSVTTHLEKSMYGLPDTDVFILLMDRTFNDHLSSLHSHSAQVLHGHGCEIRRNRCTNVFAGDQSTQGPWFHRLAQLLWSWLWWEFLLNFEKKLGLMPVSRWKIIIPSSIISAILAKGHCHL